MESPDVAKIPHTFSLSLKTVGVTMVLTFNNYIKS